MIQSNRWVLIPLLEEDLMGAFYYAWRSRWRLSWGHSFTGTDPRSRRGQTAVRPLVGLHTSEVLTESDSWISGCLKPMNNLSDAPVTQTTALHFIITGLDGRHVDRPWFHTTGQTDRREWNISTAAPSSGHMHQLHTSFGLNMQKEGSKAFNQVLWGGSEKHQVFNFLQVFMFYLLYRLRIGLKYEFHPYPYCMISITDVFTVVHWSLRLLTLWELVVLNAR